jgi:hypothetical protein
MPTQRTISTTSFTGICQARRGWLAKADVPNTRPLDSWVRRLKRKEAR